MAGFHRQGFVPPDIDHWPDQVNGDQRQRHTAHYDVLAVSKDTLIWRDKTAASPTIIKLYFQRGVITWWRMHAFAFRVEREFNALRAMHDAGVPVSVPVAWSKGFAGHLGGRFEALMTEEIPDVTPLSDWLSQPHDTAQRQQLLFSLMSHLATMHHAGIYHGALYTRNVLVSEPQQAHVRVALIDTPKAVILPHDVFGSPLARLDMINFFQRLTRSRAVPFDEMLDYARCYGFKPQHAKTLIRQAADYQPSSNRRNLERAMSMLYFLGVKRA